MLSFIKRSKRNRNKYNFQYGITCATSVAQASSIIPNYGHFRLIIVHSDGRRQQYRLNVCIRMSGIPFLTTDSCIVQYSIQHYYCILYEQSCLVCLTKNIDASVKCSACIEEFRNSQDSEATATGRVSR